MMSGKTTRGIIICVFMLLVLLFFTLPLWSPSHLLYQGDIINSDITELNFPARNFLSTELDGGGLPFWNPYIGCGFPVVAEGQTGVFYPPNLALFGLLDPVLAFNFSVILSLLLALIFSYLLFRHYQISVISSLFAATAFTFSGFMMSRLKFTYMINAICWMPLAVYGLEKAFSKRNLKYLLLCTPALAMQVLAGGAQVFLITISVMAIICAWRFISMALKRNGEAAFDKEMAVRAGVIILGVILAVSMGAAIAMPQLMPQLQGYPHFNRAAVNSYRWSLGVPMQPRNLVQFVSPYGYGNPAEGTYDLQYDFFWENIAYPGLLALVLVLIAILFLIRKDNDIKLWLLIGVLALLISLGDNTPLAQWIWKYVPGFKMFRFYQRYLIVVVLAMTIIAGKSLDYIFSFFRDKRAWHIFIAALVFVVLLVDLGLFAHNQYSTIDADRYLEPNETVQWLEGKVDAPPGYQRIAVLGENEAWKQAYTQARGWLGDKDLYFEYLKLLPANYNSIFEIPSYTQYGDYGIETIKQIWILTYYAKVREAGWQADVPDTVINVLAMQGTRYILTPYILDNEGLTLVKEIDLDIRGMDYRIYEIDAAMPRAYITRKFEVIEDSTAMTYSQVTEAFWNMDAVQDRVILEREPALSYDPEPEGSAEIVFNSDQKIVIEADSPQGGILVLNDSYYPEWHVFVDGEERDMLRGNIAFRAVELGPGSHAVEFVYRPASSMYGLFICVAALLLLLLLFLYNKQSGFFNVDRYGAEEAQTDTEALQDEPAAVHDDPGAGPP
jgi:hypothetical protein